MRKSHFLIFLLIGFYSQAQQITGIIIDVNTKKTIENVFVFVENSSVNTISKKDGSFSLDLNGLKNNVIVDYLGYHTYLIPKSDLSQGVFSISLYPYEEIMEELVIQKSLFTRKQMMHVFKKYFLGNTQNGKSCKIRNEDDIILYFDTKTNTLIAEAIEPIVVENKNLDYEIKLFLKEFKANFNAQSLDFFNYRGSYFLGYSSYNDVSSYQKASNSKRRRVYEDGIPAFLKALAENKLEEQSTAFFVDKFPVNTSDYFKTEKVTNGYVIYNIKVPTKKIPKPKKEGGRLVINADNLSETIEVPVNFNIYNSKNKNQSIVQLNSKYIEIDKNGNLLNPNQIYFGGYFGDLKLGDMLPIDFIYR